MNPDSGMNAKPFWMIYRAGPEQGLANAAILSSIGCSRSRLEAALEDFKESDAVLVEFVEIDGQLSDPRIVGHMTEGKEALLVSAFPAAPPGDWQSPLPPAA